MSTKLSPRRRGLFASRWLIPGIGAILILVVVGLLTSGALRKSNGPGPATVGVTRGPITATVNGIGTVAAAQTVDLALPGTGPVTDVLVKQGDLVTAGQPLVRLDDRALKSQVVNAQAGLDAAQARLGQSQQGNAKSDDVAAATAQLASAQASYAKLAAGPSAADVASAQSAVQNALAHLKDVTAGPTASDVSAANSAIQTAQSQLAQAQQTLADTRAKPRPDDVQNAELALEQAKNSLWSQQVSRDAACGAAGSQSGTCKSANAAVGAQETAVTAATVKLAQAKEPATPEALAAATQSVQSAKAGLASAQAKLAQVRSGASAADRQAAQTQVDQARASLDKLQSSVTANDVAVAKASIDQAQANLNKLTAPSTVSDLTIQQATVVQAQEALKQAQINLDNATLKAPFAGIVSQVNVVPGSGATSGTAAIRIVDRSTMHLDLKLSENDVVKVAVSQPVTLTDDSLVSWSAKGTVSYVAPAAETVNGVVTYAVRVTFADDDPRLRVGMTSNVSIITAHKDDVLLVPNATLLPKGTGHVVEQLGADGKPHDVDVQVGLTDGTNFEIVGGLQLGDQIVAFPAPIIPRPSGGLFGGG